MTTTFPVRQDEMVNGRRVTKISPGSAKRTLAGDVYGRLRADILTCRVAPGSKLRINEVCAAFGVNLGAVREALSKLTSEGLVIAEAQRGFRVAPVSRQELADLVETRVAIENLCFGQAVAAGDVAWESRIVAALHSLSRLSEREPGDAQRLSEAWVVAHETFHAALVSACRNQVQLRIRAALYDQSERYRRLSVPVSVGSERDIGAEHRAIAEAALDRDAARATELLAEHLNRTAAILLKAPFLEG